MSFSDLPIINPITGKLYSQDFKNFRKENPLAGIPLYNPEITREFQEKFRESEIMILEAQTGAGKSVAAPIHVAGLYGFTKKIAMSEPRTVNAFNITTTLAKQLDVKPGEYVGYLTGAGSKVSKDTKFFVMTDALLFQSLLHNPEAYDIVIIDEFHERNINIDMCLAIIKRYYKAVYKEREFQAWKDSLRSLTIKERYEQEKEESDYRKERRESLKMGQYIPKNWQNPTKFLLLSATIDSGKYIKYYSDFKVTHMFVSGRTYPIRDVFIDELRKEPSLQTLTSDPEDIKLLINYIITTQPPGDILTFLPGKADILAAISTFSLKYPDFLVGGIFRGAPEKEIEKLTSATRYKELGFRGRLLFATNIAETGITINGLKYVIEIGTEKKIKTYEDYIQLTSSTIPRSSAKQRCGRVGRTEPGTCYHLYTKQSLESFQPSGKPAIFSENLENLLIVLLNRIKSIDELKLFLTRDIPDPLTDDDLDPILLQYFSDGMIYEGTLSYKGELIVASGLEYKYGRLLLLSFEYEIPTLITPIIAILSGGSFKDYFTTNKGPDKYRNPYGEPHAILLFFGEHFRTLRKLSKKPEGFKMFEEQFESLKNFTENPEGLRTYAEENLLNFTLLKEIIPKIQDIEKKINDFVKSYKDKANKNPFHFTWKMPISDFKGDDLDKVHEKVTAVFRGSIQIPCNLCSLRTIIQIRFRSPNSTPGTWFDHRFHIQAIDGWI